MLLSPGSAGFNTQTNVPEYLDNIGIWHSFAASGAFNIGVGSTSVSGATNGFCLTNNGGVVGNVACGGGGTGTLVVGTSPITGGVNGDCLTVAFGVLGIASCGSGGGGGVTQIAAGTGVSITPGGGTGVVTISNAGVNQIAAGTGISVSPGGGTGVVTISNPGVLSLADNGGGTLSLSPTTGAVFGGCTTATTSQIGCSKPDAATLGISAGVLSVIGLPSGSFSITAGCGNTATNGAITPANPSGSINSIFRETRAVTTCHLIRCKSVIAAALLCFAAPAMFSRIFQQQARPATRKIMV